MPGQVTCPGIALSAHREPVRRRHRQTWVPATRAIPPYVTLAALLALTLTGCAQPENGDTVGAEQSRGTGGPTASDGPVTAGPSASPGGPASVAPSGRTPPPLSSTDLPTLPRPTGPPDNPTDVRRSDLLAGRITRGGTGPCYGLVTDDGREYALHGENMGTWGTGTWVRVTIGPPVSGVDCGPGTRVELRKIEPVG
ncbi:hypothetical protein ACFO0M_21800 [Micromonospora mangrovi]|uniref:Uncharacterized protein n=2 Tax=Micromonospora TaxID=1873 RepID=A0AAU7M4B5_9ACTN